MRWTQKARIQRVCSRIPGGGALYYSLQRRFGGLQGEPDPRRALDECALMVREMNEIGRPVFGARVLEVGTGRLIEVPIGFYLAGAKSTITVDLNRYLRADLVAALLNALRQRSEYLLNTFRSISSSGLEQRLSRLLACQSLPELLNVTNITYLAPADATQLPLESGTIDIHTSFTVLEHVPRDTIVAILREASRLLTSQGIALHRIDLSDHFAHDDPSISYINFLQFSQRRWNALAGNRFGYHNRLRPRDYREVYLAAGHDIKHWSVRRDERSERSLREGFPLDRMFAKHPQDELGICGIQVISR